MTLKSWLDFVKVRQGHGKRIVMLYSATTKTSDIFSNLIVTVSDTIEIW